MEATFGAPHRTHKKLFMAFSSIALLTLSSLCISAEQNSAIGDWLVKMTAGEQQLESILSFSRDSEGNRTGQLISFWEIYELKDVKFEENQLSFTQVFWFGENESTSTFKGTIEEGKLSGTITNDRGETKLEGARMPRAPRAVGSWEMKYKVGEREITGTLVIKADKERNLSAEWQSQRGEDKISDLKYERGNLSFKRASKFGERQWESTFEGNIRGDTLTGAFKSERGEMKAEGKLIGAPLIGNWNLDIESKVGFRKQRLTVKPDMSGLYGTYPIKKVDLEDDKVSFKIVLESGELKSEISFQGKLADSKLTGELTTSRGTSKVKGTKRSYIEVEGKLIGVSPTTFTTQPYRKDDSKKDVQSPVVKQDLGAFTDALRTLGKFEQQLIEFQKSNNNLQNELAAIRKELDDNAQKFGGLTASDAKLDNSVKEIRAILSSDARETSKQLGALEQKVETLNKLKAEFEDKASSQFQQHSSLIWWSYGLWGLFVVVLFTLGFFTLRTTRGSKLTNRTLSNKVYELEQNVANAFDFMNLFPRKNPYMVGSPIIEKEMLFGRSEIVKTIVNGIHGNHYYIQGERRSGKTSLLRRLTEEIEHIDDTEYYFQPIILDFQSVAEETLFKTLCFEFFKAVQDLALKFESREFLERFTSKFESRIEKTQHSRHFVNIFHEVYDALAPRLTKHLIFVLILDEFDKINGFDVANKEGFRWIFMRTTGQLHLIAAGGKLKEWDRSSPFNFMVELKLSQLTEEDARQLILKPSKGVVVWEDAVVDYILNVSKRKPYEIQKICYSLVSYSLENRIFRIDNFALNSFLSQTKQKEINHESHIKSL